MSKVTKTTIKNTPTNVTTTGKSTSCVYKMNNKKIDSTKKYNLQTTCFELVINGVKMEISDSVQNIKINATGISINL